MCAAGPGHGWASFGFGILASDGCDNCTGYIEFDEDTVTDVSDPATNPEDCDPALLDAADQNFGLQLLTPESEGGFGDYLTMGLVDSASMDALGLSLADDGTNTASEISDALAVFDFVFTHAGYVHNLPGSLAEQSGLDSVADNAGSSSNWYGYWQIYKDPVINPHSGTDMEGEYAGQTQWTVTFGS